MIRYTDKYLVLILEDENGDIEYNGKKYIVMYSNNWVDAPTRKQLDKWIEVDNLDFMNDMQQFKDVLFRSEWLYLDEPIKIVITHEQISKILLSPYKALVDTALSMLHVEKSYGYDIYAKFLGSNGLTDEQVKGILESFGVTILYNNVE